MAKQIMQFRCYGDGLATNQPTKAKTSAFTSGSVFDGYYPIISLKIHGPEGTEFFINGGTSAKLGSTKYYELNIEDYGEINKLYFKKSNFNNSENNPLIIDIIYEK